MWNAANINQIMRRVRTVNIATRSARTGDRKAARRRVIILFLVRIDRRADERTGEQTGTRSDRRAAPTTRARADEGAANCADTRAGAGRLAGISGLTGSKA